VTKRPPQDVRAAGAVLWRETSRGVRIAVVHRPRYDDWSLPKGKLDRGETAPEAAVRELSEETGFRATLGRRLRTVRYPLSTGGMKTVEYFSAAAHDGTFRRNGEVDELRWLTPDEAGAVLSYGTDARVVRAFLALPAALSTLLLARHGKAGKRGEWTGEDDLRPLSPAGLKQAAGLRAIALAFGVDRVLSAPPVRCVATVEGVAGELGVEIGIEPLLSEQHYWPNPETGLNRLLAIVTAGGTPIVASQGGVIPDVLATLAARSGIPLTLGEDGTVPCRKGSVWMLSFRSPEADGHPSLAAADYYPTVLPAPAPVPG